MQNTYGKWVRVVLLAATLVGHAARARAEGPRVIEISAKRFAFTPAEVHLKKGEPVTLRIRSGDVIHGLYLKALGIDAEIEPGQTSEITITPRVAGRFSAICDHFCGAGHGNMHMTIVVE